MEIDDRDPPWTNDFIKNKIKQKNKAFRLFNLSHSCQSVVKNLKELILVWFFNLLKKINCLM